MEDGSCSYTDRFLLVLRRELSGEVLVVAQRGQFSSSGKEERHDSCC